MYISGFRIDNYRSLRNVSIANMKPVSIFHGLNNSGKSNVLSALEMIFSRKPQGSGPEGDRRINFWTGQLDDFADNYYRNNNLPIRFGVNVTFDHEELRPIFDGIERLPNHLANPARAKMLFLEGEISHLHDRVSRIDMSQARLNQLQLMVRRNTSIEFLPTMPHLKPDVKLTLFERLFGLLDDSFAVISAARYLRTEQESMGDTRLTPDTFKQWLFNLSLNRAQHTQFKLIKDTFNTPPFSYGELSFSRENGKIEIMVEKDGVLLPITRMGSGLQQVLYLISCFVTMPGKMVGVEELEINLSPTAQKQIFEKMKAYLSGGNKLINQLLVTSHSDYFEKRGDVRCFETSHDGVSTTVSPWTRQMNRAHFH